MSAIPKTCPECNAPAIRDVTRDTVTCTGCGWIRSAAQFVDRWIEREQAYRQGRAFKARL